MSDFEGLWVTLEFGTVLSIHENCHINIPKKEEQQVQSWKSKARKMSFTTGWATHKTSVYGHCSWTITIELHVIEYH